MLLFPRRLDAPGAVLLAAALLLAAGLASPHAAHAQAETLDAVQPASDSSAFVRALRAFERAARQYTTESKDLYRSRGAPPPLSPGTRASALDVVSVLSRYPVRTTLVMYHYASDSTLSVFALDCPPDPRCSNFGAQRASLAKLPFVSQVIPRDSLETMIAQVGSALGVDRAARKRAPQPRDASLRGGEIAGASRSLNPDTLVRRLSAALFPPEVRPKVKTAEHLVIMPAGSIGTVPFPLLRPFGDETLLVEHASVILSPSLYDLVRSRHRISWVEKTKALVVGDPAYGEDPDWTFPPLPGAEAEAKQVAARFGVDPLLGPAATENTLRQAIRQSTPEMLYLATHGVASPAADALDESFIALSGPGGRTARWTAREIQHGDMPADLVVLSACQTGLGRSHDAGIIGLARAFQIAGAAQVAVSLWSVDDDATAALMTAFVDHLEAHPPPEALRRAMLDTRLSHPSPADWASFVIFGTTAR